MLVLLRVLLVVIVVLGIVTLVRADIDRRLYATITLAIVSAGVILFLLDFLFRFLVFTG